MQLYSRHAGLLQKTNSHFSEFYAGREVTIACFTSRSLPLTFEIRYREDSAMIDAADDVLSNIQALHTDELHALSQQVIARYCEEFPENAGALNDDFYEINKRPENIWAFIYPQRINIRRYSGHDPHFYLQLLCDCDWDPVDGLELIFYKGNKFVYIGPQHCYFVQD
jgi:hypothetical protein